MKRFMSRLGIVSLAIVASIALNGCNRGASLGPAANADASATIRKLLATGGEASGKSAAPTGTGWATIKGQFVYGGDPPQMPPYDVTKEHNICSDNGKTPQQELLVVAPSSQGIKNVAIFLREASRVHESANPKTEPVVFDQKHCVFLTHVVGTNVGQTLDIKNSDPTGHNTNIPDVGFNQSVPSGGSIPFKIQKELPKPAKVVCSIHPWMVAYLLPRKNAYYAVTDAEGNFEIANVPAGEPLEFQVWHESGAAAGNGLVGKTADSPELKWTNKGRLSVTLEPDTTKEIKVVVPPSAFRL